MALNLQREIRKKTLTYGITAVFIAILLTTVVYNVGIPPYIRPLFSGLKTFSSYEELENFLQTNMEQAKGFTAPFIMPFFTDARANALTEGAKDAPAHSTTNVHVAGVDEADCVKTDGEYLYVVSGSNIYIVKAYPPNEAKVLSKIALDSAYEVDIFLNGDKLAVLGKRSVARLLLMPYMAYDVSTGQTIINVYDISNKTNPVQTRTISYNGTLSGSRMISDYVYVVVNEPATGPSSNETNLEIDLPKILVDNMPKEVQPTEVRYIPIPDIFYYFTTVIAVNIMNDAQEPTYEPLLTGATSSMYVSQSNMYLTTPDTRVWFATTANGGTEETLICRAKLDNENVVFAAQGSVTGHVLNQFSMDEYNGFFRVATTNGWGTGSVNSVYVLDMGLNVVGILSNIAQGEQIYSARFMSDRCYLVTFRQVDPFFVIDLGNPTKPKILGYLKIPGFSGYLHPYDENYIIGIGKENSNVKLSLFNVTDVTAPTEAVPSYIVQAQWSDTTVLTDHKAFLFNKTMQLLALPVSMNWYEGGVYHYSQGAYVFNITLSHGFVLKGNVTHLGDSAYWWNSSYSVKRILYIDDVLYTVSDKKVNLNSLGYLWPIKEIELS
jgi:uncharacterized secreted protein with C-terminal beta-propeller domain